MVADWNCERCRRAINEVRKRRVSALPGAFWGKGWGTLTSRRSESRNPPRRTVSTLRTLSHLSPSFALLSSVFSLFSFSPLLFPPRVLVHVPLTPSSSSFSSSSHSHLCLRTCTSSTVCSLFVLSSDLPQCSSSLPLPSSLPFFNRSSLFLLRDIVIFFVSVSLVSTFIWHFFSLVFLFLSPSLFLLSVYSYCNAIVSPSFVIDCQWTMYDDVRDVLINTLNRSFK